MGIQKWREEQEKIDSELGNKQYVTGEMKYEKSSDDSDVNCDISSHDNYSNAEEYDELCKYQNMDKNEDKVCLEINTINLINQLNENLKVVSQGSEIRDYLKIEEVFDNLKNKRDAKEDGMTELNIQNINEYKCRQEDTEHLLEEIDTELGELDKMIESEMKKCEKVF